MKNFAIARRYAKALLLIGREDGQTERYKEELGAFSKMIAAQKELEQAICNPLYETGDRKKVLKAVVEKQNMSDMMKTFLFLLFDKGRMGFIGSINEFYRKLADELKGIATASIVSATALTEDTIEKIQSGLSKMTGKTIQLEIQQDPDLIGGIVTKIGDLVLDGSIRTQLMNMRESLKRGESV